MFSRLGACQENSDRLMLAVIAATLGAFSFYWYSGGPDFGARYWYLILVPCIVLTARGIQYVEKLLRSSATVPPGNNLRICYVTIASLCVIALVGFSRGEAIDKILQYLE